MIIDVDGDDELFSMLVNGMASIHVLFPGPWTVHKTTDKIYIIDNDGDVIFTSSEQVESKEMALGVVRRVNEAMSLIGNGVKV